MKIKIPVPTLIDITHIQITAPRQDVLDSLGGNVILLSIEDGSASVGGVPIKDFDEVVGLGSHQRLGEYALLAKSKVVFEADHREGAPAMIPHDPNRPGMFRLTVRDGVVFVGDAPWKPTAEQIQAFIDAA